MKELIAYFSASETTKALAERMAKAKGADLFEIIPTSPYTDADLDWRDRKSRSSLEMSNPSSRPEIAKAVENIREYDVIYLGFPIWWYRAPTIINSFLEMHDLKGKTIIPFATSGGSGMGETNEFLKPSCQGAKLMEGRVLSVYEKDGNLKTYGFDYLGQ